MKTAIGCMEVIPVSAATAFHAIPARTTARTSTITKIITKKLIIHI